MRNILNQSHDQARMFRDELEATKKKAAERLAQNRKQYEERLRIIVVELQVIGKKQL